MQRHSFGPEQQQTYNQQHQFYSNQKPKQQGKGSLASLVLTGDLRGISYLRKSVAELPSQTFNFCCTIDGTANKEADLSTNLRPIKREDHYGQYGGINSLDKLREHEEDEKIKRQQQLNEMRMQERRREQEEQLAQERERLEMERKQQIKLKSAKPGTPHNFWSPQVVRKYIDYANLQRQYSTIMPPMGKKNNGMDQAQMEKQRKIQTINKYEEIRQNLQKEVDKEYQASKYKANVDEKITFEQYQEMKQQINYDIAWQIFDEVNQSNDPDKYIDLNCLELSDAKAITKQKIYDVALLKREQTGQNSSRLNNQNMSYDAKEPSVLIIQCSEEHIMSPSMINDSQSRQGMGTPVNNGILDVVKNELKLDHHHLPHLKMILVKIDQTTLDNSVLNDY